MIFNENEIYIAFNQDIILRREKLNHNFSAKINDDCTVSYRDDIISNDNATLQARRQRRIKSVSFFPSKPRLVTIEFADTSARIKCKSDNDIENVRQFEINATSLGIPKCGDFDNSKQIKIKHELNNQSKEAAATI
jgi:hypothetical protein